ncbi:MAG: DUF4446 family protein [Patescibacteria group bacterium]|nr:DUF4446 family protein [Patescibacteria group bacterium]
MVWILIPLILILLLAIWTFYLHHYLFKIRSASRELFKQAKGSNLEEILNLQNQHLKKHSEELKDLQNFTRELEKNLGFTIQKTNIVRFNAFPGEGGDQSFSIALLDQHQNGVVVSNLRNRNNDRIYAKPVKNGQSPYHLTKEELEAINPRK